jgi:hypothetical protein
VNQGDRDGRLVAWEESRSSSSNVEGRAGRFCLAGVCVCVCAETGLASRLNYCIVVYSNKAAAEGGGRNGQAHAR